MLVHSALSDYASGQSSAPVRRSVEDLQKLPTATTSSSSSATTTPASVEVTVDETQLLTFMHVYLIFLAEVTKRRGCSRADAGTANMASNKVALCWYPTPA